MSDTADDQHPYDDEETGQPAASSSSSAADQDKPGCCGSCVTTFRQEFHVRNFGFNFHSQEAFQTCQWRWPTAVFVFYRVALAIYSVSIVIWTASTPWKYEYPWPTWVTYWSYSFLALHLVNSAIVALIFVCRRSNSRKGEKLSSETHPYGALTDESSLDKTTPEPELPFHLKLGWFLFVIASGSAPVVTTVYWVFLAPDTGVPFWQNDSINQHLINTVIVVLELVISAIPVRLLHFVYITAFGFIYAVFTAIYWAFDHDNILYKSFTNWNQPTTSIIRLAIVMFVVAPIIQFVMFSVYQIRLGLYWCIYHQSYTRPALQQ